MTRFGTLCCVWVFVEIGLVESEKNNLVWGVVLPPVQGILMVGRAGRTFAL